MQSLPAGGFRMGKPTLSFRLGRFADLSADRGTWGTDTSKYPEEKRPLLGIPLVAASESGEAQTLLTCQEGVLDSHTPFLFIEECLGIGNQRE